VFSFATPETTGAVPSELLPLKKLIEPVDGVNPFVDFTVAVSVTVDPALTWSDEAESTTVVLTSAGLTVIETGLELDALKDDDPA
jgi:hypothetical protein